MTTDVLSPVTCIMPTANRRRFMPAAIAFFLRQDYPYRELIIVDDGADAVRDLVPSDPRVEYVRVDRHTIGAKRNIACERARGRLIAHWDDDDWHAPNRLSLQVHALESADADIVGLTSLLFCNPDEGLAWRFDYDGRHRPWLGGSSLLYRRSLWERTKFANIDVGEDARFLASLGPRRVATMRDAPIHVGRIHAGNVSRKHTGGPAWRPLPITDVRAVIGDDWSTFARREPAPDQTLSRSS